jgi:hypothetical protein
MRPPQDSAAPMSLIRSLGRAARPRSGQPPPGSELAQRDGVSPAGPEAKPSFLNATAGLVSHIERPGASARTMPVKR